MVLDKASSTTSTDPEGWTPASLCKVMTIPQIGELYPHVPSLSPATIETQQGCVYSLEQSPPKSTVHRRPRCLSARGQSPGKTPQGKKTQRTCLKKRTTEPDENSGPTAFSRTLFSVRWDFKALKGKHQSYTGQCCSPHTSWDAAPWGVALAMGVGKFWKRPHG